jgi:phosphonopyruvate decarboxylase
MINCGDFFTSLKECGINFFTGVPDSLLKNILGFIADNTNQKEHICAANEGNAIALAAGYHLATKSVPMVYLQNSGLGNAVNPLISLTSTKVYSVPMVLMIGWRGEPGVKDEPQHQLQGELTRQMLEQMSIPYEIISSSTDNHFDVLSKLVQLAKKNNSPTALLVKKGAFTKHQLTIDDNEQQHELAREQAIEIILDQCQETPTSFLATTGMIARELYELRVKKEMNPNDFYNVGAMGHISQVALGVALNTTKKVICLDGDGSILMHMGSLATNGSAAPKNFLHIALNNGAHDSVGGQPTVANKIDLVKVSSAVNYKSSCKVESETELITALKNIENTDGPHFIEILVTKGARPDLGRPKESFTQIKENFMKDLQKELP